MTVKEIQASLIKLGYKLPKFGADGQMGEETRQAVIAFQKTAGLVPDGNPGPQTQQALAQALSPPAAAQPEPNKSAMSAAPSATPSPTIKLLDTSRPIDELIWHCTATPEGRDYTVDDIRSWHKQRGWSDIGYHYVVYRDGTIVVGRPIGQIGSHVAGHNTGTIGCSYVGGLSADGKVAKDTRTAAQRASMLWLTRQLVAKHGIKKVTGHNQYAAKACPSFDVRSDELGRVV